MNYAGMQEEILDLFREAQTSVIARLRVRWGSIVRSRTSTPLAGEPPVGPATIQQSACVVCGGIIERRPGTHRGFHLKGGCAAGGAY